MVFATLQALIGTDKLVRRFPASVFVATSPDPAFVPVRCCHRGTRRNPGHWAWAVRFSGAWRRTGL